MFHQVKPRVEGLPASQDDSPLPRHGQGAPSGGAAYGAEPRAVPEQRIDRATRFAKRLGWGQAIPGWSPRAKAVALALYRLLVAWERRHARDPGHLAGVVPIDQRAAARALTASLGFPVSARCVHALIERFLDEGVGLLALWAWERRSPDRDQPHGLSRVYVVVATSTPEVLAKADAHLAADVADRPRRERERLARYRRKLAEQAPSVVDVRDDHAKQQRTKDLQGSEVSPALRDPPGMVGERVAVVHGGARPTKGGWPLTFVDALAAGPPTVTGQVKSPAPRPEREGLQPTATRSVAEAAEGRTKGEQAKVMRWALPSGREVRWPADLLEDITERDEARWERQAHEWTKELPGPDDAELAAAFHAMHDAWLAARVANLCRARRIRMTRATETVIGRLILDLPGRLGALVEALIDAERWTEAELARMVAP